MCSDRGTIVEGRFPRPPRMHQPRIQYLTLNTEGRCWTTLSTLSLRIYSKLMPHQNWPLVKGNDRNKCNPRAMLENEGLQCSENGFMVKLERVSFACWFILSSAPAWLAHSLNLGHSFCFNSCAKSSFIYLVHAW